MRVQTNYTLLFHPHPNLLPPAGEGDLQREVGIRQGNGDMRTDQSNILFQVLSHYQNLGSPTAVEPIIMGQINKTFLVTSKTRKIILQELSPIFPTAIMDDAWAVALHLEQKNIKAPTILRTDKGQLFVDIEGKIFRALTYIEGSSYTTISSLPMAHSAGKALGVFHRALLDFAYDYRSQRRHGGDYSFHQENLLTALKTHTAHDYFGRIAPLAQEMLMSMGQLMHGFSTTPRHAHGDPKISNLLFDTNHQAVCLVDFDTLGKTGWSLEVADALRSWCNPYPEDVLDAHMDLGIAEQTLAGYGSIMRGYFSDQEGDELMVHSKAITLCLAMRYAADTLNESYFLHDQNRFSRPAEHNWLKTQSMLGLFRDFCRKGPQLRCLVDDLLRA